ncbi:type II secretion system F family protein [Serratia sp. J2]|uniref:type II secretion system F family protein n=1 Tax=Serratia sp. J2 TaxID=3386551 RepID=UPI0039172BD2
MIHRLQFSLQSVKEKATHANRWLYRHSFSANDRIEFYEMLAFLLDNEKPLRQALSDMRDVATDFGRKKHPSAVLLTDCIHALDDGESIEVALLDWVPIQEATLIGAGVLEGNIAESLRRASRIVAGKGEMLGAIKGAVMYPSVLIIIVIAMMYMVNAKFIPQLEKMVPREKWEGAIWWLGNLSQGVIENGILFIILAVLIGGLIYWSLENYTGKLRRFIDSTTPWSLYRIFQGVTFLLNVSALLRVNIQTLNALNIINENASPWLQQRVNETQVYIRQGQHLGKALKSTGYNFPSKECVNQMMLLTEGDGAENILEGYANRWLKQAIKDVKKKALRLTIFCFVLVFSYMATLLLAISQINSLVDSLGR